MALMPLVRQRLEVVTELVSLRSARDAVARSITITDAARREDLAALMRDNAEDINALAAQRANVGTQLAAAEQLLGGITTTTDMYFFGNQVAADVRIGNTVPEAEISDRPETAPAEQIYVLVGDSPAVYRIGSRMRDAIESLVGELAG